MKRFLSLLFFCALFSLIATTSSSCSRKTGCPVNENAHVKPGKNGQFSSKKRGKSNLFPKNMRRRKGR
ncbi:MAG: hypothetical protein AAFV25_21270 [Bacteroidota bacterium]